jgi:hypothetical protein
MTILGEAAPQPLQAAEIALRLPDNSIKTSVQAPVAALAPGSRAAITTGPDATIQPF